MSTAPKTPAKLPRKQLFPRSKEPMVLTPMSFAILKRTEPDTFDYAAYAENVRARFQERLRTGQVKLHPGAKGSIWVNGILVHGDGTHERKDIPVAFKIVDDGEETGLTD